MLFKQLSLLSVSIICTSLLSCKKQNDLVVPQSYVQEDPEYKISPDGKIKLGEKLENPYTVDNMNNAYQRLRKSARTSDVGESPVRLTHYYVRFLPSDWEEYDRLIADSTLYLYETPLDYSIELHGNTYHDPSIPADKPTWQYTSVKKDFNFPNIKYEILADLYIPETDTSLKNNNTTASARSGLVQKSFVDALIDEAMVLTKNFGDTLKPMARNARYNPVGIVTVYDTRLGRQIPLQGVHMRARRWFTYKSATTNADGWFQTGSFERPANYSLFFETGQFDVRTGTWGQAWIDGPKSSSPWLLNIGNDANGFYAHVFRGAYRYHYGNIDGLKRPKVWSAIKYCAYDKNSDDINGDYWGNLDPTGIVPDIRIYRTVKGVQRDSDAIFSTTVHETAHASHSQLLNEKGLGMISVNNIIIESWAVAVQWHITAMEYRERGVIDFAGVTYNNTQIIRLQYAYQYWNKSMTDAYPYTSLFIDLVDDYNQCGKFPNALKDNVKGYTLVGIESTILPDVLGVDTWIGSLKRQLKKIKPAGVTDSQIDELLNQF